MSTERRINTGTRAAGPPENVALLDERLAALRARYPGAVLRRFRDRIPDIHPTAFVAEGAVVVGDVKIGPESSVWYGCVLRGDVSRIEIGARTNIQDGSVVHLGDDHPAVLGDDIVVGHRAVVHGCSVQDGCLVGIGATILNGAEIGAGSIVGSHALVTEDTKVPAHTLVLGVPAKVARELGEASAEFVRDVARKYTNLAHDHRAG